MDILKLIKRQDPTFYDPNFISLLESHLTYLRTTGNIRQVVVTEHQLYKYEGDLYGLLDDLSIEKKYHYIVGRVNFYESSNNFTGENRYLIIPDLKQIDMLSAIVNTASL